MKIRLGWAALLLALVMTAVPAWAAFDLPALAAVLAQRKSGETRFTEERFVSGFDSPLRASGTLSFTAPDRFARYTVEPHVSVLFAVIVSILSVASRPRAVTVALFAKTVWFSSSSRTRAWMVRVVESAGARPEPR